jgi:fused signal recognition particle receptor
MSSGLKDKITKTRNKFKYTLEQILFKDKEKEQLLKEIEELLILADIGWSSTQKIINSIENELKVNFTLEEIKNILEKEIINILTKKDNKLNLGDSKSVIMLVGANGSGKTTCAAKLANYLKKRNKKTMMVAADTFRAAAVEQLYIWGERLNIPVFKNYKAQDPASVVFDALNTKEIDVFLIDTAGRLHTKINLMQELEKIARVTARQINGAPHEVLLVIDAGFGHNAIFQAREFLKFSGVTGLFVAKLDGTAKGGCVIGISDELNLPVKFIGIGEGENDILEFSPQEYAKALLR